MRGRHDDSFSHVEPENEFKLYHKCYRNLQSKKMLVLELDIIKKMREKYLKDIEGCNCESGSEVTVEEEVDSNT